MFRCGNCKGVSKPGEKPIRLVVESREKVYDPRFKMKRVNRDGWTRTENVCIDPGGRGHEIVREINACADCAKKVAKAEAGE
jgi:hypothetical protein